MTKTEPVAKLRSENTRRSRIGSRAVSSRMTKPTSAATAMTDSATIRPESNQSSCSPRSRTSWRQPKPTTISTSPSASMRPGFFRYSGSKRKVLIMKKPRSPIGRLM